MCVVNVREVHGKAHKIIVMTANLLESKKKVYCVSADEANKMIHGKMNEVIFQDG